MSKLTIHTIVGARPQFIKAAALSRAVRKDDRFDEKIINTDQHYDDVMSKIFFEELDIPTPHYSLGVNGGSHGEMTARMLIEIEKIFLNDKPDIVMVYGDTNSTLAGALAATKLHIPIVHVEAGLRSFNRKMPEEINRVLTDHISGLLLCPTQSAVDNLADEGITNNVIMVGDVMHDATLHAIEQANLKSNIIETLSLKDVPYAVVTLHRQSNTDDKERLVQMLNQIMQDAKDMIIVFPIHPRTKKALQGIDIDMSRIKVIEPLGSLDFHKLLMECEIVITDSGGLQKEAYFHRKPCITLRDETEWVETIEAGWNRLWTTPDWKTPRQDIADYGDGKAAEKCLDVMYDLFSE